MGDFIEVDNSKKHSELIKVINNERAQHNHLMMCNILVFCSNHIIAEEVEDFLRTREYRTLLYHGKLDSYRKTHILMKIRKIKSQTIIVSTDAVARGFDLLSISHVIMFDFPRPLPILFIVLVEPLEL